MPRYVDGFVLPVPKKNAAKYRRMARKAGKIWREHGALAYFDAYRSRRHGDQVLAKVMADPRLKVDPAAMPFDGRRMIYGGFEVAVEV